MSWFSDILSHIGGGSSQPPTPLKFSSPINNAPQSPTQPSGGPLPLGGNSPFTSAQQSQIQSALNAAGIWGTIQDLGGDVWGAISKVFPKNGDGSIDWGKVGGDIYGFIKDHGKDILSAASAYNSYQRQGKADQLGQDALKQAQQHYDAAKPLRDAGMSGLLNPSANTPDISGIKAKANVAPLSIAPPSPADRTNLNNAQSVAGALPLANLGAANRIAGAGSGNPFATAATADMPSAMPPGSPGSALPLAPPNTAPRGGSGPAPLPIGAPMSSQPLPSQPARYLQSGLETSANGSPVSGGYSALSDTYRQTGTTPGVVNDKVLALVKQNPNLINALPLADQDTLRRTMQSVGA